MIRATFDSPNQQHYRAPGGAWDLPPLDVLLTQRTDHGTAPVVVDGTSGRQLHADEIGVIAAQWLAANGVRAGDAVVWQLPNSLEAVALYRGCWKLGAVAVPVHHLAGSAELDGAAAAVSAKVVVTAQNCIDVLAGQAIGADHDEPRTGRQRREGGQPILREQRAGAVVRYPERAQREGDHTNLEASDVAAVLFTAGSTGRPKGVLHTHQTLGYKARLMPSVHGLTPQDTVLMPAPLSHVSGLLNGVLVPQVVGMTCVLMPRWDPAIALDLIETYEVTFMVGPPTFFVGLMNDPSFSRSRVRSLRLISTGGAGVRASFVERAANELGARVKRSYGSTEAPTVATSFMHDPWVYGRDFDGRAVGEAELRVSTDGELLVRGPEVCVGYLDPADNTDAFESGGWFRTGDRATITADGWLTITGRVKDIIIRGGENISVTEVESVIAAHPAVAECAVVGFPDDRLGERAAVFVVLRRAADSLGPVRTAGSEAEPAHHPTDTANSDRTVASRTSHPNAAIEFDLDECRRWCELQGLARFKWPERVEIIDTMPVLTAGKIDRRALASQLCQRSRQH